MNYSKRISAVKLVLFALIFVGMSSRSTSSGLCSSMDSYYGCNLNNVSIHTEADATKFVFPSETKIRFQQPTISSSAKILFGRLPNIVQTIRIYYGHVPKVYISHTIFEFHAYSCGIQEVIIDQTDTYKIRTLEVQSNLLRAVPENIVKLTNLVELDLSYNKIETVSMDHFKNLTNLKILRLYNNLINRVDTTVQLNLLNLENLFLYGNRLQHLSITFWNFPNLNRCDLDSNKLRSVINFPMQFPKLKSIDFRKNQWSCGWLEAIKSKMSKIKQSAVESCPGRSVDSICCQDYSIDEISFEEPWGFWLQQLNGNLQKAIQQIDDKITKLTTDTNVQIDSKIIDVGRTVQKNTDEVKLLEANVRTEVLQELKKINAKVDENRALILDDRKKFQEGISNIGESILKLTTDMQEKVTSIESNIRKEILKELTPMSVRLSENQASIANDQKLFHERIDQIGESISKLTSDTTLLIDNKISNVARTVQEIKDEVKSAKSSIKEQNQEIEKLTMRVEGLEEKTSNSDNQNKENIKWVKQKVNENRALIDDIVEDLYFEELEKQEL